MATAELDEFIGRLRTFFVKYGKEYYFAVGPQDYSSENRKGFYCLCFNDTDGSNDGDGENFLVKYLVERKYSLPQGKPEKCRYVTKTKSGEVFAFPARKPLIIHYLLYHPRKFIKFLWKVVRDLDDSSMKKHAALILMMWEEREKKQFSSSPFYQLDYQELKTIRDLGKVALKKKNKTRERVSKKPVSNMIVEHSQLAQIDNGCSSVNPDLEYDLHSAGHETSSTITPGPGSVSRDPNTTHGYVCQQCGSSNVVSQSHFGGQAQHMNDVSNGVFMPLAPSNASIPTATSDATMPSDKSDATMPSIKSDATMRTATSDATMPSVKSDETMRTDKSDATMRTATSDATMPSVKSDETMRTDKSDATMRTATSDATMPSVKSDVTKHSNSNFRSSPEHEKVKSLNLATQ
ncbi:uncharacterized protein LOC141849826 [Brevipalpus obovatus]|uniref:uncharacterized protein LOC141849826 n=1 Tax=Brevipalpus obovatus TaxID=246614 RepID=UPI003D9E8948